MSHYEKYGKKYYEKHKDKELARAKDTYDANKDKKREQYLARRSSILKRRCGVTEEDYQEMLLKQGGCCAICGTTKPGGKGRVFHIDHCHVSGAVRGLLCVHCNHGLGSFNDSVKALEQAIAYLNSNGVCGI